MTAADQRQLGRSGIAVSPLGLGCWAIGGPYYSGGSAAGWGEVDDEESIRAIHAGLEMGVNFLDTSDIYGTGHSEEVLARALAGRRDQVVIATKFGNTFDATRKQGTGPNAAPEYIRQACDASLKRLNTDYIDLYQFHLNNYDPALAPEVRETLETLVEAGKIRAYGWSTDFPDRAAVLAEGPHCTAMQFQMNVLDDAPEMVAFCETHNQAGIIRGPLAMGLLTGKYAPGTTLGADDVRGTRSPAWMTYFKEGKPNPEWLRKLDAVREILTSEGRTLAQGAIAWLWRRSPVTLPIPGFRTVAQVQENAGTMAFGPLTVAQMAEIDQVLDRS